MLRKIISGGQDGVDIAALRAAKMAGLQTGGDMPNGFRTVSGNKPEYAAMYGMRQTASYTFTERTKLNVQKSDATIFIGHKSPGYYCTSNAAQSASVVIMPDGTRHGNDKPFLHISLDEWKDANTIGRVGWWLFSHGFETVNIAGNRNAPEAQMQEWVYQLICEVQEFEK